ncbi:MAG TPA: branched-chain amino acid ABC transporter permease [Egibacteraceae bacterium]|nr:branched-chain amino acid ABC transporter permease [Egibacteraceae bacterium]
MATSSATTESAEPPASPPPGDAGGPQLGLADRIPLRRIIRWGLAVALVLGIASGAYQTLAAGVFSPAQWRDLVVFGIAQGSIYALIALGYTLVYGILFMINFAHGEVFMAGGFTAFFAARAMDQAGFLNQQPVLAVLILLAIAMAVSTTVAVTLERVAYRPLRNAPRLIPLITAIGASLFLQYSFRGLYGEDIHSYPRIDALTGTWTIAGIPILRTQAIVIVAALALMVGLYFFISRTTMGRSMRAVAEDREIASLMGIDVNRVIVTTFAIGGMLAGAAGILYALVFRQVHFLMGFLPGIKAFTAAVIGGIGSIIGAAVGGLLLGLLEAVAPFLLLSGAGIPAPNQLKDVIAFSILVIVLIMRPGGLFGSREPEKL